LRFIRCILSDNQSQYMLAARLKEAAEKPAECARNSPQALKRDTFFRT